MWGENLMARQGVTANENNGRAPYGNGGRFTKKLYFAHDFQNANVKRFNIRKLLDSLDLQSICLQNVQITSHFF